MVAEATILTPYTSLVFIIAPLVYFASVVVAAAMLPNFFGTQFSFGDVFVFIGVLTLGRFFMTYRLWIRLRRLAAWADPVKFIFLF